MIYDITHVTEFDYEERVSVSHHVARLTPRRSGRQTPLAHAWTFDPAPAVLREHQDVFGNPVAFFAMQGPHRRLSVTSRAAVEVATPPPLPARSPAWETVRDGVDALPIEVFDFVVDSPLVAAGPAYAAYAAASFPPGRADRRRPRRSHAPPARGSRVRARGDHDRDADRRGLPAAAAASARTSPTCRSPACARSACRRAT